MFVAEAFNIAEGMKHRPLIYPIAYKSAVYAVILLSFHVVEDALIGLWRGKTLGESISSLGGGSLEEILVVALIMGRSSFPRLGPLTRAVNLGRSHLSTLLTPPPRLARAFAEEWRWCARMLPRDQRIDISSSSNDSFIQMFEMQLPVVFVIPRRTAE